MSKLQVGKTYVVRNTRVPYCCAEIDGSRRKLCVFPSEIVSNKTQEVFQFLEMPGDYEELERFCNQAGKVLVEIVAEFAKQNGVLFCDWVEKQNKDVVLKPVTMRVLEDLQGFYVVRINNKKYEILGDEHFDNLFEIIEVQDG